MPEKEGSVWPAVLNDVNRNPRDNDLKFHAPLLFRKGREPRKSTA